MKKSIALGIVAGALLFMLAGCGTGQLVPVQAQQGGGLVSPSPTQINSHNGIVDSSTALTIEITNFCNGQAQVDYAWLAGFCGGAPAYSTANLLPSTIPTQVTQLTGQGKTAWCQSNLWIGPSGQLSIPVTQDPSHTPIIPTLGNCPSGTAPAPIVAPSGAAATRS